jgi:hypothetical protein
VQFAAEIMSYFLFHGIKLENILIISCLVSIVKYNNINNLNYVVTQSESKEILHNLIDGNDYELTVEVQCRRRMFLQ